LDHIAARTPARHYYFTSKSNQISTRNKRAILEGEFKELLVYGDEEKTNQQRAKILAAYV
jgi:hypothetical protein